MTNHGVMESSGGGLLDIAGIVVAQGTNGQLLATGGNVQFDGAATISGGALNASGTSVFIVNSGGVTFNSVTNNAPVNLATGTTLTVTGNLVDNGDIAATASGETISVAGGAVSGTGTIVLYGGQLEGSLTQGLGIRSAAMGRSPPR